MKIRSVFCATAIGVLASSVSAGQFDGLYFPTGLQWSCNPVDVGMDGGSLQIEGNNLIGVENFCELSQPTPVRGMDAVLYDANCAAEGEEYSLRVMLLRQRMGVYVITEDGVADWTRCR